MCSKLLFYNQQNCGRAEDQKVNYKNRKDTFLCCSKKLILAHNVSSFVACNSIAAKD